MKVQIKYKRGGRVKTVDDRFAKALVKAKIASYVQEESVKEQKEYETKELKAEKPKKKTPKKKKEETVEVSDNTYKTKDLQSEE